VKVGFIYMGAGGARGRSESRRCDKWAPGSVGVLSRRGTSRGRSQGVEEVRARERARWAVRSHLETV